MGLRLSLPETLAAFERYRAMLETELGAEPRAGIQALVEDLHRP